MESSSSSSHQEGPLVILALLVGSLEMSLVFGLQAASFCTVACETNSQIALQMISQGVAIQNQHAPIIFSIRCSLTLSRNGGIVKAKARCACVVPAATVRSGSASD
ncbi:Mediator of RNA polymerase II transcription subunit 17 isoform H [Glycine soja]|uniref:Mediator of RNA polymerase II transcription subunit 17 isoform G n=1 Tax=Glycine soja TaxID=3848 RepID=A0A445KHN8_GLYSO|nr:Mediator of RNA polymerase II transcription subunit 17 isoform G [Glycine soja]RZC10392.1 Mediator of RNA polymerase II transcription subunit 17 isoform H [Glycine soja]